MIVPTRNCGRCEVNLPGDSVFKECPGCGGDTKYVHDVSVDKDWEARVAEVRAEASAARGAGERAVLRQRLQRLTDDGLAYDCAVKLAGLRDPQGGYVVDVGRFSALVADGATPDQAARILG